MICDVARDNMGDASQGESEEYDFAMRRMVWLKSTDSSYERGAPTEFPVAGVIPGFSEGLQLMKTGAKYRLTITADQAYGPQAPPKIGPNQVLIFDVELIEVIK